MAKSASLWWCVLGIWLLCACGMPVTYTAQSANTTVQIMLPSTPKANISQDAIITIQRDGSPIDAQNVVCDMQMPGMTMGANRPIADKNADGTYRCGLLFTMSGEWVVIVRGEFAAQPFEVVVADILVSE